MPLTGNTAKIRVIEKIKKMITQNKKIQVLDAGCGDLNLWLDSGIDFSKIAVHGFDRSEKALEKAKQNASKLSKDSFQFYTGTALDFPSLFDFKFDLVVSTNVLEHLKNIEEFFTNIRKIMNDNALGLFSCDSAHYISRKTSTRKGIEYAYKIKRQYVDDFFLRPLETAEIKENLKKSRLELKLMEYYCIDPLKYIHNHIVNPDSKNQVAEKWFELEKLLNENESTKIKIRKHCSSIYFETKPI